MKKVVFTFGRMNPPTIGHQKLVDKVNAVAKSNGADARVYLSHTQNAKKDPLSYADKIRFARKAFGSIMQVSDAKTLIQILKEIEQSGYTDIIAVFGGDRIREMETLINKYNGKDYNFDSIKVVSAGERDPDSTDPNVKKKKKHVTKVSEMSASAMRELAKEGQLDDYEEDGKKYIGFRKGLPKKLQSSAEAVMKDVVSNLSEEVEMDEERKPLTIQQRMARGRMMKRIQHKIKIGRKRAAKRMADSDKLKKRSKKMAIAKIRTKVAGEKGKNYKDLSAADKITIDKLVMKRSAVIDKLAKRLLPKVRSAEKERLAKARSAKNEELDIDALFEATVAQDKDIKDREGTQPKKYFKDLKKSTKAKRDAAFKKGKEADDSDPNAYKPAPGDADAETKPSKHTKKYHKMFGDKDESTNLARAKDDIRREKEADKLKHDAMKDRARIRDAQQKNAQTEEFELSESAEASLRKKAEKSGIPYSTLKKVYDRGMAAWKTGHRPGATQQQWGFARVNSFITKGKGTWGGADKDLAKGVKKESVDEERDYKKEYENYQGKPEQIARRSSRNKARRIMGDKAVKGKDVGHKDNNPLNNDPKNLRMEDPSKNRREPRLREEIEEARAKKPNLSPIPDRIDKDQYYFTKGDMESNRANAHKFKKKYGGEIRGHRTTYYVKSPDKVDAMVASYEPMDEARAKKAVAGGKVQKLITGFGMSYKGKKYDEIDFELDSIDNSSQIVTLKILHPAEHIGDKVKVPFKTLRVGRFMATDTSKINEACWDGYKQVGLKKKGNKMVPDCVPETKEAVNAKQQAAIAISKKEKNESVEQIDEDWFTKLLNRYLIKPRTYKYAKQALKDVLARKKKEGTTKSDGYYAQRIANSYGKGIDARDLLKMVNEEGGAGDWGTDKLKNKYKKDTPNESCCEECEGHFDHIVEEVTILEGDEKKKVKLNDPVRGGPKKFYVYTKNDKGNVVKVTFGDPNMEIKRDDPEARKRFRARHNCADPGPKWKARYWSCYQWRSGSKVDN